MLTCLAADICILRLTGCLTLQGRDGPMYIHSESRPADRIPYPPLEYLNIKNDAGQVSITTRLAFDSSFQGGLFKFNPFLPFIQTVPKVTCNKHIQIWRITYDEEMTD